GTAGSTDGTGTAASFNYPSGLDVDAAGNIYVADYGNNKIRKITPAGVVSTFAGTGTSGSTDGAGTTAKFWAPSGVALDAAGNIYVADYVNHKIRKITPAGVVSTLAGTGTAGSTNGTGTAASFNYPSGLAVDAAGYVYVSDQHNLKIRKITPAGVVSTLAGSGTLGSTNGDLTTSRFNYPYGVAVDATGNVYVSDTDNRKIRKIAPFGYSISPALPAGLSFDGTNGTISGTPTAASAATNYTITGTNTIGSSSTILSITVNAAPVANAPTVTTQAVTAIAQTTATGNGNITDLGTSNPTAYGVCWNTAGSPTTADSKTDKGAISATGAFTADMTGLTANTKYYVRA
ncbi:putative Ig domain-containing protein, partial [bacterium]|nr:putative Ig domain-containing protein [bacterium]